jgi:murein DD-endopeptidase MepM/ murein hydrolase activator NlpD
VSVDPTTLAQIAAQFSIPPAILNAVATQGGNTMGMTQGTMQAAGVAAKGADPQTTQLTMAARTLSAMFAQYGSWEPALSAYTSGSSTAWQSPTSSVGGFVAGVLGSAAADPTLGMGGFTPSDPQTFANMVKSFGSHIDELVSMGGVVSAKNSDDLLQSAGGAYQNGVQKSAAQAPNFSPAVTAAITSVAKKLGVPVNLAMAIAQQESGGNPNSPGGGLYQLEVQGGEGAGMTPAQIADPTTNATKALTQVAAIMKANPKADPGTIAALAQRPADPSGYAASVNNIVSAGVSTGGSTTGAMGAGTGSWYDNKWANSGAIENPQTSGGAFADAPFPKKFDQIMQVFGPGGIPSEPTYAGIAHFHTGVDYAVPNNTPLTAAFSGTVHLNQGGWGGGNFLTITAPNGWSVGYGHENDFAGLQDGQQVTAGQVVAHSGSTGNSTGPHLHLELRSPDGTLISADPYVNAVNSGIVPHPLATTPAPGMAGAPAAKGTPPTTPKQTPDQVGEFAMQLQGAGIDPQVFAGTFANAAAQWQRYMGTPMTIADFAPMANMPAAEQQQYIMNQPHPTYPEHTVGAMANMHAAATLHSVPHAGVVPDAHTTASLLSANASWPQIGEFFKNSAPATPQSAETGTQQMSTKPSQQQPSGESAMSELQV